MDKTDKVTRDKSVTEKNKTSESNEEKKMSESKSDNVEEDQAPISSIKNMGDIVNASINFIKNEYDTVDKVEKSRTNSVSNRPNKIPQVEKIQNLPELIIPKEN